MVEPLDIHFQQHQSRYARPKHEQLDYPLMRVHAEPIVRTPAEAMEYILKALLRRWAHPDELLILPKARSEFKTLPVDPRKLTGGGVF
jgi:hypothetical protein